MRTPIVGLAATLMLSGCAGLLDPYQREGTWRIAGVNQDNLRAMVVDRRDLQRGTGTEGAGGQEAAAAVTRLRTDKLRELPSSALSSVGGSSGSGGAGGGGAGAALGGM